MKITAFNPLILTPKGADAVKLFEELGFERRHTKTGINDQGITSVDLKDANGFRVDVTQVDQLPRDMVTIRMNVNNFEEAYEFLKSRGFVNFQGDKITDTGTSKAAMMISPSGFSISVSHHIRKEEKE
jgi:hypothetical protein